MRHSGRLKVIFSSMCVCVGGGGCLRQNVNLVHPTISQLCEVKLLNPLTKRIYTLNSLCHIDLVEVYHWMEGAGEINFEGGTCTIT